MATTERAPRGARFWAIMLGLLVAFFAAYLETTVVSTALPTIASALHADEFIWVGTAYSIAFTALLPLTGGLADAFGRRPVLLGALLVFTLGSALAGAAQTMDWLVAARTLSGLGAGVIGATGVIIMADVVPLKERGTFNGLFGLMMCLGGGVGPLIGGALADEGQWRWSFFIVVPLAGLSAGIVLLCFNLPSPEGDIWKKTKSVDWIGTVIVAGSSVAMILGLSWGGVQYAWSSAQVLAPLVVGGVGMLAFFAYEFSSWATNPLVPIDVLSNRTSVSGYLQTFMLSIPFNALLEYMPVFYQACQSASPTASGVDIFGLTFTVAPLSILTGLSISFAKRYRPQIWLGWAVVLVGFGLLSSLGADASRAQSIGYPAVAGVGIGLVWSALYFPVLSPLDVALNARALSLFGFCRAFSQTWGFAIGGAILQNELLGRLPPAVLAEYAQSAQIAYAVIPRIAGLPPDVRGAARAAFADSLAVTWRVMIAVGGAGLAVSVLMGRYEMQGHVDAKWQAGAGAGKEEGGGGGVGEGDKDVESEEGDEKVGEGVVGEVTVVEVA
ncbi:iron permease [Amylostereum chailletii]|nr:iron permease [Amylostereum chailletii]